MGLLIPYSEVRRARVYVGGVYLASHSLMVGLFLQYVKARLVGAQDIDKERVGLQAWRFIR